MPYFAFRRRYAAMTTGETFRTLSKLFAQVGECHEDRSAAVALVVQDLHGGKLWARKVTYKDGRASHLHFLVVLPSGEPFDFASTKLTPPVTIHPAEPATRDDVIAAAGDTYGQLRDALTDR